MKSIKTIKKLYGKKVLVRVDFNIPLRDGKVVSDYKLTKSLPTIEYLLEEGAKVILVSHLGRPKGVDKKLSLAPVAKRLGELLQKRVDLLGVTGESWKTMQETIARADRETVLMLENIRFLKEEEADEVSLGKALAHLCDIFVLDGFAVSHRRAASVSGVAKYVPSYAGLLLYEEVTVLSKVLNKPKRPLTVLLGGAKAETKIPVLKKLLPVSDHILVGGGIFNTYLFAKGKEVGSSLISKDLEKEVLRYCRNKKVVLPVDVIVGKQNGVGAMIVKVNDLKLSKSEAIFDVGPETVRLYAGYIKKAKTLVWNGAVGMFEQHPYEYGTYGLVRLFAGRSRGRALGICGGGETVEILEKLHLMHDIDLVSTGGGAMLEFLSGAKLPGLVALK